MHIVGAPKAAEAGRPQNQGLNFGHAGRYPTIATDILPPAYPALPELQSSLENPPIAFYHTQMRVSEITTHPSPLSDANLRDLIQTLLSKADLQGLSSKADLQNQVAEITSALRSELAILTKQVEDTATKVTDLTTSVSNHEERLSSQENQFSEQQRHLGIFQLKMENAENRDRHNNLRIRGIPESTGDRATDDGNNDLQLYPGSTPRNAHNN